MMNITRLELCAKDLQAQRDFYANLLELPVNLSPDGLEVTVGKTILVFKQTAPDFNGAYHFAFNIPENQVQASKEWLTHRIPILHDNSGKEEFNFDDWNSHSLYFKDAAGNVLEFIARHNLKNAISVEFDSSQILNVSEIGLPSEDVITFANELCTCLDLSVFKQEPAETFTPVGDDNGLFILPVKNRIWMPDSGVPAKLLPVKASVQVNDKCWEVCGIPYSFQLLS
jgi:catechol 2,3-dioxygenase-like lactoylglutathione lyase family enzyme